MMRRGRCQNLDSCSNADSGKILSIAAAEPFRCAECGRELKMLGLAERCPAAFLVFLAFQIAFFGFAAWRTASGGPRRALVKTNGDTILRIAGSNTIGSSLGPALAEGFLKQQGATDVATHPGAQPEEKAVSGTLPGARSRSIITVAAHGSATAFTGLGQGACDIGAASRKIKAEEVRALSGLGDMTSLASEHVLGLDGVAIIVNSANPLESLRVDQVGQIFSGALSDWSQVGGQPGPITVYARDDKSGTYDTFKTLILGSSPLLATAKRFEDSNLLSEAVSADREGIGFIGLPYIHSAKALAIASSGTQPLLPNLLTVATEDYALSRRLYLYTPENSQNKVARSFVEFALSKQGQDIVSNLGFVSQNIRLEQAAIPEDAPKTYRTLVEDAQRLSLDFRFRTGKSELDNKALVDLERMANFFSDFRYQSENILLLGFADTTGARGSNLELSLERARRVREEFERRGLRPSVVEGFGSELPVAPNNSDEGREKNRRVEVWLKISSLARR